MENRINNRVIITVNKRNKLLGYLRKLNSGDTEAVSVKIVHTPKEKPINLLFARSSGTVDDFLVYADFGKARNKKKVVLGSATIEPLQETGFISGRNMESKECVVIDAYAKEDTLDFEELQGILFSLVRLSSYHSLSTSPTTIIELKPENQNIINYEVSMMPNNPLVSSVAKGAIDSAVNDCDIKNEAHEHILEIKIPAHYAISNEIKTMSALALNLGSVVETSSSSNKKEIKLYLKDKENFEPPMLLLKLEQSLSPLSGIRTKSIMAYTLDSKREREILLGHCNVSSHLQNIQISISFIKEHNLKYEVANFVDKISTAKNTKIVYLNISPVSSHKATVISLDTNDIKGCVIIDKANELNIKGYGITDKADEESELVIASSMLRSDLKKPLKRWKKILKAKPIEVLTDTFLRAGYVVDFYIKESSIRVSRGVNTGLMTGYELVAKYSLNESIVSTRNKDTIISGFVFKALHNAYAEYKQRKSENLDISHLESLIKKNKKISNQNEGKDLVSIIAETLREIESIDKANISKRPKTAASEDLFCKIKKNDFVSKVTDWAKETKVNIKKDNNTTRPHHRPFQSPLELKDMIKNDVSTPKATETLVVPFSIVLRDIIAYNHLLEYTEQYKATFRFKDKEFKGEVKSINIQDSTRMASSSSIKAIVNVAITQECKDAIDNLIKELDSKEICVGSLGFNSITRSAGVLYTIKSYAEKEDKETINIDMSLSVVKDLERFSHLVNEYSNIPFMVSTDNEQAARIIYCANTEEEAVNLIMKIKDKLKNRFIENKSKQSDFTIYNNYINVEIKSFSSGIVNIYADSTILKVQDVVLVGSKDLGKYFVVAKLQ